MHNTDHTKKKKRWLTQVIESGQKFLLRIRHPPCFLYSQDKFEDTQGLYRSRKSKDRQHNSQKKNEKRENNDLLNTTLKPTIEQYEPNKTGRKSGASERIC